MDWWRSLIVLCDCVCFLFFYESYLYLQFVEPGEVFISLYCFDFYLKSSVKLWGKGRQRQSLLQRNEWISLILSSAALSAIMAAVLNAACKHFLITCKGYDHVCVFSVCIPRHGGIYFFKIIICVPSVLHVIHGS